MKKYVLKKTWIDIDTGKEEGGYFYFYSTENFYRFKFYKNIKKASVFDSLDKVKEKIKLFNLKNTKIKIINI